MLDEVCERVMVVEISKEKTCFTLTPHTSQWCRPETCSGTGAQWHQILLSNRCQIKLSLFSLDTWLELACSEVLRSGNVVAFTLRKHTLQDSAKAEPGQLTRLIS